MNILLFLVVFVLACDASGFTKILHRPLIACCVIGAIMGNMTTGIIVGSSLELVYVAYESQSDSPFVLNGGFLLSSIVGCVLAISAGLETSSAVSGAIGCTAMGAFIDYALRNLYMIFVPMARNAASKGDVKKLAIANFLPMIITGIAYGVLAVIAVSLGESFSEHLSTIQTNFGWILASLSMAGILVPCVSFAILLRNIGVKDVPGALLTGCATGAVLSMFAMSYTSLLLIALFGISIGLLDYHQHEKTKSETVKTEEKKMTNTIKGGAEKWW